MQDTTKKTIIGGAVLFVVGALIGFVPLQFKLVTAQQEIDSFRQQLEVSKRAEAMNRFRNRVALVHAEAIRNNYTVALDMASQYFNDLRAYTSETTDPTLKQNLENALSSRDAIVGRLAKADVGAGVQIQELFQKLQTIN
jgi:hypothetical protein